MAAIRLKDESGRFGLGSFKALGGAYAVGQVLVSVLSRAGATGVTARAIEAGEQRPAIAGETVTCATDGNHGRSVAWGARRFGCRCVVFVHATVSQSRADAIEAYGAEIRRVPGNYDDSVRACSATAEAQGWHVVSDTSWPGYVTVPVDVMQGYRLMMDEAADQWNASGDAPPTHVVIQAGVGGVACAVSTEARARFPSAIPKLVVVEPERAACLLASAAAGAITAVGGDLDTIMAGLACGEPSLLAWRELERAASAFVAVPDAAAIATMGALAELGIVAGESGAAGLAGLLLAAADDDARAKIGLTPHSRVLCFNTEGATDPSLYERLVTVR